MKVTRASANTELRNQAKLSKKAKVPRSCSDVFRLWASMGVGLLFTIVFEIVVIVLVATGARPAPSDRQFELEFGFGARLTAWNGFAISYLAFGLRAFSRCDRAELVRRVLATPHRARLSKDGCLPAEAGRAGRSSSPLWLLSRSPRPC
ncbi:MAG TPA: hypothetical protein VN609_05670 [Propionibacteriaceae bacterium]|nr:hypothetical protein [Propionibacteriaceae bacterium]